MQLWPLASHCLWFLLLLTWRHQCHTCQCKCKAELEQQNESQRQACHSAHQSVSWPCCSTLSFGRHFIMGATLYTEFNESSCQKTDQPITLETRSLLHALALCQDNTVFRRTQGEWVGSGRSGIKCTAELGSSLCSFERYIMSSSWINNFFLNSSFFCTCLPSNV